MVIQRIQSLYLLIAALLMALFVTIVPIGHLGDNPIMGYNLIGVLISGALSALLIFIDIFLFKNLKQQMQVCSVSMFLVAATMAVVAVCFYAMPEIEYPMPGLIWTVAVPVASFIFLMLARAGMKRDNKILRDYDHFR